MAADLRSVKVRKTAHFRAVRKQYTTQLKQAAPAEMLALADWLLHQPEMIIHLMTYELLHYHKPTLRSLDRTNLERLGRVLASWQHTDTFAPYLAGVAWRQGQIEDAVVDKWAASEDVWWRRAALVCTIALNTRARGGKGDTERTLGVCRLLVTDGEDMVVKAMSWALRELIVHDEGAVRAFIEEHEKALAARVKREVRNKLETGLKNPKKGH
jgi:3-methyladenine DNA glycosylase AlkD